MASGESHIFHLWLARNSIGLLIPCHYESYEVPERFGRALGFESLIHCSR